MGEEFSGLGSSLFIGHLEQSFGRMEELKDMSIPTTIITKVALIIIFVSLTLFLCDAIKYYYAAECIDSNCKDNYTAIYAWRH